MRKEGLGREFLFEKDKEGKLSKSVRVAIVIFLFVVAFLIFYLGYVDVIKELFVTSEFEGPLEILPDTVSYNGEMLVFQVKKNPSDKEVIGARIVIENGTASYEIIENLTLEDGEVRELSIETKNNIDKINKVTLFTLYKEETGIVKEDPKGQPVDIDQKGKGKKSTSSSGGGSSSSSSSSSSGGPVDTTPPGPITNLTASNITSNSITWRWTNPTDGDLAELIFFLNGTELLTSGVISNYTTDYLFPNTDYTFGVQTKDTTGNINTATVENTSRTLVFSGLPTLQVSNPLNNTAFSVDNITFDFVTYGFSVLGKGNNHLHFNLDSDATNYMFYNVDNVVEYNGVEAANSDWLDENSFELQNIADGPHVLRLFLVNSVHNFIGNTEAEVFISFDIDTTIALICNDIDGDFYNQSQTGCGTIFDCDDNVPTCNTNCLTMAYEDGDGDNFGNVGVSHRVCDAVGFIADDTDCNDQNASIYPGATEICGNGIDEDCSGGDLSCPVIGTCGNAIVDIGEQCDDGRGNGICPSTCSSSCEFNSCTGSNIRFITPTGSGTQSGLDWNNAMAQSVLLSAQRGFTFYLADGNYASQDIFESASGSNYIYVIKATSNNPNVNSTAGWNNALTDGAANFQAQIRFRESNIIFDGVKGGGPGSWTSGYGFFINAPSAVKGIRTPGADPDNIRISHIEILGGGDDGDTGSNDLIYMVGSGTPFENWYFSFNYLHDTGRTWVIWRRVDNSTVEYSYFARGDTSATQHGNGFSSLSGSDNIIRYNIFEDGTGTSVLTWGSGNQLTYPIGDRWQLYGNIFFDVETVGGRGQGALSDWSNEPSNDNKIYNNAFYFLRGDQNDVSFSNNVVPGSTSIPSDVYNNIFYDIDNAGSSLAPFSRTIRDYNTFDSNIIGTFDPSPLSANEQFISSNPFVAPNNVTLDFSLSNSSAINPGIQLPYMDPLDIYGNVRGADGKWDRGAYEFVEGPLLPCDLTSATWSQTNVVNNTLVSLNIAGSNCNGKQLNFTIYEDDELFPNDFVNSFIATSTTATWNALWEPDQIGDPEFYYEVFEVANVSNNLDSRAYGPLLVVTLPVGPTCTDNDGDLYNQTAVGCGVLFDCDDTNPAVNPGATEICDGVDNNCVSGIDEGGVCVGDPSLVLHLPLNGDFIDMSSYGNDADCPNPVNCPTSATGGDGSGAYDFGGVESALTIPHSSSLEFGNGDFSTSAWIYVNTADDVNGERILNDRGQGALSLEGWQLKIRNDISNWGFYDTIISENNDVIGCNSGFCGAGRWSYNEWHHVAMTFDNQLSGTDTLRIYVDGSEVYSTTSTSIDNINNLLDSIVGASFYNGGVPLSSPAQLFDGKIDEIKIYNRILSLSEIVSEFNSYNLATCGDGLIEGAEQCDDNDVVSGDGCSSSCQVESGWTCVGQPSVCSVISPAVCGDGLIEGAEQCDDNNLIESPADGCDASCNIDSGWQCVGEPSVCTIIPVSGANLVLHYSSDSSVDGSVVDDSGNGNTGTCGVGTTCPTFFASGGHDLFSPGPAYDFDGVDDRLSIVSDSSLNLTSYTYAFWAKADILNTTRVITSQSNGDYTGITTNGINYWVRYRDGGGVINSTALASGTPVGTWAFYVLTVETTGSNVDMILYKNGSVSGTYNSVAGLTPYPVTSIGARNTGSLFFDGLIEDLRIYDGVLTPQEISDIYNGILLSPPIEKKKSFWEKFLDLFKF